MNAAQAANSGAAFLETPAPETQSHRSPRWDYFAQILPAAPVVCGLQLKPLSIGRYRRMRRLNIAFVADDAAEKPATELVGDLLKGVLVCSMTCAEFDQFIEQSDAEKEIRKWGQRQGLLRERYHDWPIIGKWFVKYIVTERIQQMRDERAANHLVEQVGIFRDYIADAQRIPNYTTKENSPQRNTIHWSNSIELHLRSEQNWTTQEINEEPLSKALADYFGYAESMGRIRINTDADIEQAEANSKALEAMLGELEKQKTANQ
jgi:hypothetical protein